MKTKNKKPFAPLVNQGAIVNRLLQSMSNHSGFSEEYLVDSSLHSASHWRKLAMYILVKKFSFTYERAASVFKKKAPHCHIVVKEIKEILETDGKKHLALPYINQILFDIES